MDLQRSPNQCFDKTTGSCFSSNVDNLSGGTYFNDVPQTLDRKNPELFQVVEKLLASAEGHCGSIFRSLNKKVDELVASFPDIPEQREHLLEASQKRDLSNFMALQFLRTDDMRAYIRKSFNEILKQTFTASIPKLRPNLDPENFEVSAHEDEIKRIHIELFLSFQDYTPFFYNKAWTFAINIHDTPLLTSDNPLARKSKSIWNDGIGSNGSILVYPISPKLVLTLYDRMAYPQEVDKIAFLSREMIDDYNTLQLEQCRRHVYGDNAEFKFAKCFRDKNPEICNLDQGKIQAAQPLIKSIVEIFNEQLNDDLDTIDL